MEFIAGTAPVGKLILTVQKCDNGFIVNLIEAPKCPKHKGSKNVDEEIDTLIDGLVALNKHMEGKIDGEEWREGNSNDRRRIREAFKRVNPGLMRQFEPPPEPRIEQKVFATKPELFAYLANNL